MRQTQDSDTDPNADQTGLWKANTFNAAVDRLIALMDIATSGNAGRRQPRTATTGCSAATRTTSIYGQGGNDGISGGDGQDILEGNANGTEQRPEPGSGRRTTGRLAPTFAGDVIHGDTGADDIAGGTGRIYQMTGGVETRMQLTPRPRGNDGRRDGGGHDLR